MNSEPPNTTKSSGDPLEEHLVALEMALVSLNRTLYSKQRTTHASPAEGVLQKLKAATTKWKKR